MNSPFGQELCNHRNHWKWYDGRVIHEGTIFNGYDGTMRRIFGLSSIEYREHSIFLIIFKRYKHFLKNLIF